MAKRTLSAIANVLLDRIDKSRDDTTLKTFVEDQLVITLQEIIASVPYARWLLDEDTVTTTASTQSSAIPTDLDIDNVVTVRNETKDWVVVRSSLEAIDMIDPGRDFSGSPRLWWFQRVAGSDLLYWWPRPSVGETIKLIFGNLVTDQTSGNSGVLPAKYEGTWIDLALPKVYERINPSFDTSAILARGRGSIDPVTGSATGLAAIILDAQKARGETVEVSLVPQKITTDTKKVNNG